jgi:hypothetical protein
MTRPPAAHVQEELRAQAVERVERQLPRPRELEDLPLLRTRFRPPAPGVSPGPRKIFPIQSDLQQRMFCDKSYCYNSAAHRIYNNRIYCNNRIVTI